MNIIPDNFIFYGLFPLFLRDKDAYVKKNIGMQSKHEARRVSEVNDSRTKFKEKFDLI